MLHQFSLSDWITFLCICLLLRLLWACFNYYWNCWTSPPGDWGLPGLGILPSILLHPQPPEKLWQSMAQRHNNNSHNSSSSSTGIISYTVGVQRFVVLYTYDAVKELLKDRQDIIIGRPNQAHFHKLSRGRGLLLANGSTWRDQRRFTLSILRQLGCGKSLMENRICDESKELFHYLLKLSTTTTCQKQLDIVDIISKSVSNIISILLFGERCSYDDPKLDEHLFHLRTINNVGSSVALWEVFYPTLGKWGLFQRLGKGHYERLFHSQNQLSQFILMKLNHIQLTVAQQNFHEDYENNNYNSFMEAFVQKMMITNQNAADNNNQNQKEQQFTKEQCLHCSLDLFSAGTDTTATSLSWCILYLASYTQMQGEIYQEIQQTCTNRGIGEINSYELRYEMPMVMAFLDEVQRCASIAPRGVTKQIQFNKNVQFHNFTIRPNDLIVTSFYHIHHDPTLWKNPMQFNPKRFINETTGAYQSSKYLLQFSLGSRSCVGEILARMEMFLFFTNLVKKFEFSWPNDYSNEKKEEIMRGTTGIIHAPGKYEICLTQRPD